MSVLHAQDVGFLHRDLSSARFLLANDDQGGFVRITGLGNGIILKEGAKKDLQGIKNEEMEYCAPECFDPKGVYSVYSDVYSFGIIMWEIINRHLEGVYKKPYYELKNASSISLINQVKKLKRPEIPSNCPEKLRELMEKAWHPSPDERPTFAILCNWITQIQNQ